MKGGIEWNKRRSDENQNILGYPKKEMILDVGY